MQSRWLIFLQIKIMARIEEFRFLRPFAALGKRPWTKVQQPPEFWNARDKSGLRCISGKDMFGKLIDPSPIYASEGFAWELWGRKAPTKPASLPQLRHYVEHTHCQDIIKFVP